MSKTAVGLGICAALALGALYLQQQSNTRALQSELALLRQELRLARTEAARHAVAPSRPTGTEVAAEPVAAENLSSLREEIGGLRASLQTVTRLAEARSAPTALTPVSAMRNHGRATPETAAETLLWAAVNGELDIVAGSIVLSPSARERADSWFDRQSDETRRQYGSPEKLMALLIARDAGKLTGMRVLGQDTLGSDDTILRVRFAGEEGKTKDDTLPFHRSAGGWQLQLSERAVEKFARQLGGGG